MRLKNWRLTAPLLLAIGTITAVPLLVRRHAEAPTPPRRQLAPAPTVEIDAQDVEAMQREIERLKAENAAIRKKITEIDANKSA